MKWFNVEDDKHKMLSEFNSCHLVRERASLYKNNQETKGFSPETYWAGDNGLVVGGLISQKNIMNPIN